MARFIMFERQYSWLQKKGWGNPLICMRCTKPIQLNEEVYTYGGKGGRAYLTSQRKIIVPKRIFHAVCFDRWLVQEKEARAKKPIIRKTRKKRLDWLTEPIS